MKIKICCDNGANIHSRRCDEIDVEKLGYTEEEWKALSDSEKFDVAQDYVSHACWIEIWYEEK